MYFLCIQSASPARNSCVLLEEGSISNLAIFSGVFSMENSIKHNEIMLLKSRKKMK